MYEIYKINEDLYQVHSTFTGETSMEGTCLAILTYCVHTLGFEASELEYALLDLIKTDRNAAHFGTAKRFIYSFNRKEKYGKSA